MTPYPEKSKAPEPVEKVVAEAKDDNTAPVQQDAAEAAERAPEFSTGGNEPDDGPLLSDGPAVEGDIGALGRSIDAETMHLTDPQPVAETTDRPGDVFLVVKPVESAEADANLGTVGQVYGVCRTRGGAEKLSDEHDDAEIHTYAYVEDSPLYA